MIITIDHFGRVTTVLCVCVWASDGRFESFINADYFSFINDNEKMNYFVQ